MAEKSGERKLPHHVRRRLVGLKRRRFHPVQHVLGRKYRLSKKTVFYMKEYGPKSHIAGVIIKESILMLVIASVVSSLGGIYLSSVQQSLDAFIHLLILIPALTDMIGDYGTIVSAKFTTLLYLGSIRKKGWLRGPLGTLFSSILAVAVIASVYVALMASVLSYVKGFALTLDVVVKVVEVSMISTLSLVALIFFLSVLAGFWLYSRGDDPNNWLVPLSTAAADFGALLIFSALVLVVF